VTPHRLSSQMSDFRTSMISIVYTELTDSVTSFWNLKVGVYANRVKIALLWYTSRMKYGMCKGEEAVRLVSYNSLRERVRLPSAGRCLGFLLSFRLVLNG
jgi:hypothetical protein